MSVSERPPGARVPPAQTLLVRSALQSGGKRAAQRTALREPAVIRSCSVPSLTRDCFHASASNNLPSGRDSRSGYWFAAASSEAIAPCATE